MKYDVPLLNQSSSPICFVVCAAMVQRFWQGRAGHDVSTTHLTGGMDPLMMSIPAAEEQGLYTQRLERAGFTLIPKPASPFDSRGVTSLLSQFGPLVFNHFVANFNYGPRRGGKQSSTARGIHAVVITGIVGSRAFFNNPWGDKDVEIPAADLLASIDQSYSHPYNALFYASGSTGAQDILD